MYFEEKKEKKIVFKKQKLLALGKALSKSKYLSKEQKKELMLYLKKTKKIFKSKLKEILLPKQLQKTILMDLLKSKLTRGQILMILNFVKTALRNLFSNRFDRIPLGELKKLWHLLPQSLKSLLIAFQVMKDEMMHQHRLELEKRNRINPTLKKDEKFYEEMTIEQQRKRFFPETELSASMGGNFEEKKNENNISNNSN